MLRVKKVLPFVLAFALLCVGTTGASADRWPDEGIRNPDSAFDNGPYALAATCAHTYDADGVPLPSCYGQTFTIGGNTRSVSIYYTTSTTHGGNPHNHWINNQTEAEDVADWAQQAWERYYADSGGVEPWTTGCGGNLDFLIRKGDGWAGIAYWASSGKCRIGIDAPMVRGGGGRGTTYHEMQHYEQYGFDDCYDDWKPGYSGNAEFIEGYADYGRSTIDNSGWYNNNSYNAASSMYNRSYGNRFVIYLSEQVSGGLGPNGSPGDAWYRSNGMYEHYRECEAQDDLYVERDIVQANTPYSYEEFFMNFFAANWGNDWADEATQPELHYYEEDVGINFASISLTDDVSMSGGTQSWTGISTPDTWAGRYYQVRPQSGCDYLTLDVDGQTGAKLGINLMAADTSGPSLVRSAWVGEDFTRTFAAYGVHDRLAVSVNAFHHNYNYDVTATCVTPQIEILEPRQTNFAMVGDPTSPIAFLARVRVTSGGDPVRGLVESSFSFDAEGDAVTVVADTLQEIGSGEYWATLLPPTKAAGTTFVDFKACLDATCDTETNALLYVAPGNSDIMILHDESGSMSTEDVIGEGTRLQNAQKAAAVWANLAQSGDRYGVMGFNAKDNPVGCGLPFGTGNCELDINTHLARTDITNPTAQIPAIESAINATMALEWTPIGAGLTAAKDALQASPSSLNPKYIILLSDGEENVNPLYSNPASGVQQEMIDSGVVVHTIGFSGDAPSALLSQIAADTGGIYRYVPASPGDSMAQSTETLTAAELTTSLIEGGIPEDSAGTMAGMLAPTSILHKASLGLADTYDFFETEAQGATRIGSAFHEEVDDSESWRTQSVNVDQSANTLRLVSAGRQWDADVDGVCEGYHRYVEVLQPDVGPRDWIPVSPPTMNVPPPPTWDIRNSYYVDVVLVPNPQPGTWQIRTRYDYIICRQNEPVPMEPQALESDFLMNASVQSLIRLEGRFLEPFEDNQGLAGDHVPIVAALMQKTGTLSGAFVLARVDKPGSGYDIFQLYDDGNHGDGKANDGIYGRVYPKTTMGGPNNVIIAASFPDPADPTQNLVRVWYGSFYVQGDDVSQDDDPFPWWWEKLYPCMDPDAYNNPQADYDEDGLINGDEWLNGTNPCDPDTDDGGEMDGSEVTGGRDPLYPPDDKVRPILDFWLRPLNGAILVRWSHPFSYTLMTLNVEGLGPTEIEPTGAYTLPVENGKPYSVTLQGQNGDAFGPPSEPQTVTPQEDPDPPSGFILINDGAERTVGADVTLRVDASDTLLDGMPSPGSAASIANDYTARNLVSAGIQMRFTNDLGEAWTAWEPYATEKAWTLDPDCVSRPACVVYAQFKDGAGNESLVVYDEIFGPMFVYLPLVLRE